MQWDGKGLMLDERFPALLISHCNKKRRTDCQLVKQQAKLS